MLPCEIVRIDGNRTSSCGEKYYEQSTMQWKFKVPNVEKTNESFSREWRQFVAWLRSQELTAKIDFGKYFKSKWKISNNKMTLKIVEIDGIDYFRVRNEENLRAIEFKSQIEHAEE